jgi:glc operon protein GlcG
MTMVLSGLLSVTAGLPAFAQAPPAPAPVPGPTLAVAERMLAGARAKAMEMGVAVSCVVLDTRGDLVAAARMDGVPFLTIEVAKGKATASAFFGQPSGAMGDRGPVLQSIGAAAGLTILTVQGAVPIVRDNRRVGGIGCSGATGQQDEDAARAGVVAAQ